MKKLIEATEKGTLIGIDIGSTTAKVVVVKDGCIVYSRYERHMSQVREKTLELLRDANEFISGEDI